MQHLASMAEPARLPALSEHPALALLPLVPTLAELEEFTQRLLALEPPEGPIDIHTLSHVHGDLYGRSVVIAAGTFVAGAVHKIAGFAMSFGDITSWTVRGRERFTGAHLIHSVPGPRVVFAHADTTWFTVHPNHTGTLDVATIEESIVERADMLMSRRTPKALQ